MKDTRIVAAQSVWRIFRWPLVIFLVSLLGLISALVGDGGYDILSWIALGLVAMLMGAAWFGWSAK